MRVTCSFAAIALSLVLTGCSGSGAGNTKAGSASLSLNGTTYKVGDVAMAMETGPDGWFRIDGEPVPDTDKDCVPGLSEGLSLYGDLPSSVHKPLDLIGKRVRVDFTGDGDEANFCFAGMGGLAGAEEAYVTFESVTGNRVTFTMEGSFKIYDENGDGPIATASATGTAVAQPES
jgi:hypothetical protein